jgi:hypothetical protein
MPVTQKKKAKGLPKRTGNPARKQRRARYWDLARMGAGWQHNKLSRILRRNGIHSAELWAAEHMADKMLRLLRVERGV